MDSARERWGEGASGGVIERGREGARWEEEQGRGYNFKGGIPRRAQANVQYIHNHSTTRPLALILWYYK